MGEKRKYIFAMVQASEFDEWLNARADEGYELEKSWMVSAREQPRFAVVMRLARLSG